MRLIAVAVGLAVLSGCDGAARTVSTVPRSTTATSGAGATSSTLATTESTAVTSAVTTDPLEHLLITSVPAGYVQQDDSAGDTGPSDLAKAVADDGLDDAEAVLTAAGFAHGYQRLWQTTDERQIIVFLNQFQTAAGASTYNARTLATDSSDPSVTVDIFPVPAVSGAKGLSSSDGASLYAAALFTKGPYAVQITVNGPVTADLQALVQQLAADQFSRL